MSALIGSMIGLVLGSALLGSFTSWIIRKLVSIGRIGADAIGVAIATLIYLVVDDSLNVQTGSRPAGIAVGVLCGLAGFGLRYLITRRGETSRSVGR